MEPDSEKIGEISPVSDVIIEYNVSELMPNLEGIAAGSDGNIWFTESAGETGIVGKISPATGIITEYNLPHYYRPNSIIAGPDGSVWLSSSSGYEIGNINLATDVLTLYSFSTTGDGPEAMAFGSDGNVWFTETLGLINNIGKISPATGIVTEYNVPNSGQLNGITAGPDGNLWFVDGGPCKVDSISPTTGTINEYPVP
jgi:streptogramin lyase